MRPALPSVRVAGISLRAITIEVRTCALEPTGEFVNIDGEVCELHAYFPVWRAYAAVRPARTPAQSGDLPSGYVRGAMA